ncbi:MAG: exodeoxyribonuclease III [Pseudomonadota bacterium]
MRVLSWNVNGLRACTKKGFLKVLARTRADVFCVQEVRALPEQLDDKVRAPKGWHVHFHPAGRRGYSGVAIYARQRPTQIITELGIPEFDREGRLLIARFGRLSVASVYFPKGNGRDRDNSRVPYKLGFYQALFEHLKPLRRAGPVVVAGDFNTAHRDIDLARPAGNRKSSGFLPEERAEIDRWLAAGWVDVFRNQHPGEPGHYTWWRQFGGAREQNVGWRIDYMLLSPGAARRAKRPLLRPDIHGSDHCPIGLDLNK